MRKITLKPLHWYAITWIDSDPEVGLCIKTRPMQFLLLSGRNGKNSVEELDSKEQVIGEIGPLHLPSVPSEYEGIRLRSTSHKPLRSRQRGARICKDTEGKWVLHYYLSPTDRGYRSTFCGYRSATGGSKQALVKKARSLGIKHYFDGLGDKLVYIR